MRYISGALKPGGKAFVIVPLGMLNRTESKPKERLLSECNLLASIQLPRNTFFNTSQPTCIIVLQRRHTEVDLRPPVFCALIRTIGETLDASRIPAPNENDLALVADQFIELQESGRVTRGPIVKIVPANQFSAIDRWDVARFWTEDELVALGIKSESVERGDFIDQAIEDLKKLLEELETSKSELAKVTTGPTVEVSLSDATLFSVRSGTRIRNEDIRANPGLIPVYTCSKDRASIKGSVCAQYLKEHEIPIESAERPLITVMANGATAVGRVFVRQEECVLTDDVIAIEILIPDLDPAYVATELRLAIAATHVSYEAKLFLKRVLQLTIKIPETRRGSFDLPQQREIAAAAGRIDLIRAKLHELGKWSEGARIT